MADVAEATQAPVESQEITSYDTPRNPVLGIVLLFAGILVFFFRHLTNVYLAEALALILVIWGLLLINAGPLDLNQFSQNSFYGAPRNLVPGIALLLAGVLAFSMHMTNVFFAEAMAWVFVSWGLLLIYASLLDIYQIFIITDDALIVYNPLRPWGRTKEWAWAYITRMDVIVRKKDVRPQDAKQQVYFQAPGELAIEREDHAFDPKLAELIVEHAGLRPVDKANPKDMTQLPTEVKATFTWQR